ncbi:hypothetical protein [Candidatus Palauibacter sp.]
MDNASDQGRLPEMFDVVDGVSGEMPGQVLAGKARRPRRSTQRRPG